MERRAVDVESQAKPITSSPQAQRPSDDSVLDLQLCDIANLQQTRIGWQREASISCALDRHSRAIILLGYTEKACPFQRST